MNVASCIFWVTPVIFELKQTGPPKFYKDLSGLTAKIYREVSGRKDFSW